MSEKKDFIKEKIVRRTGAGKGFRSFIKILTGAVIFGIAAACVFVLSTPYTQKLLGAREEKAAPERVTIPRDEPETLATVVQSREETETETAPEDGEIINDVIEEESTEAVEEIVQEVIEGYSYSAGDLSSMWKDVAKLCDGLDKSIVTVRSHSVDRDMFDNERSHEGEYSGVIVAETDDEIMILTMAAAADYEDDLTVEITENEITEAQVRGVDSATGLAVVSIAREGIEQSTLDGITPIVLGNSYQVDRGDMLIAMGCPGGVVRSTAYDWVSYIESGVNVVDGTETHIYGGNCCSCSRGTWVFNIDGKLIGWVACEDKDDKDEYAGAQGSPDESSGLVIGISEYKSILERMINAGRYAYIGLNLVQLPAADNEVPEGLYVVEVAKGSPAYEAGILAGDTLIELSSVDMRSPNAYAKVLENLESGTEVEAVVSRDAIEEYKEISYTITVGERE